MTKIVLAAGASGGHIMPAIVVSRYLKKLDNQIEIHFVGTGKEIEKKLYDKENQSYHIISFVPFQDSKLTKIIKILFNFPFALAKGINTIRKIGPDLVIGFGGYPSFIPLVSAKVLGIPVAIQEQNPAAGLANKILSLIANKIFASESTKGFLIESNITRVNNPVREEFSKIKAKNEIPEFLNILILGGSQGAVSLNTIVIENFDVLSRNNSRITHQTGKIDFQRITNFYKEKNYKQSRVIEYIDDISTELEKADLVISRAGALTVSEISESLRPTIFAPLQISRGHQKENITSLLSDNACWCLKENSTDELKDLLLKIFNDKNLIKEKIQNLIISKQSSEKPSGLVIAEEILAISKKS